MSGRSSDIEVLNYHPARRLGYRRCGLVMHVVPDVDYADMQPPPSGIQPLPTIAGYSPAVDVPGPGNRLASLLRHPRAGLSTLGFSTTAPPEQTARFSMPTSTPTVGALLDRRQWLSCLHREAGKPAACGAVDGNLVDAAAEPQMLHHGYPPDLGDNDRLTLDLHRVRTVVGPEALLVLSALEAGKPQVGKPVV